MVSTSAAPRFRTFVGRQADQVMAFVPTRVGANVKGRRRGRRASAVGPGVRIGLPPAASLLRTRLSGPHAIDDPSRWPRHDARDGGIRQPVPGNGSDRRNRVTALPGDDQSPKIGGRRLQPPTSIFVRQLPHAIPIRRERFAAEQLAAPAENSSGPIPWHHRQTFGAILALLDVNGHLQKSHAESTLGFRGASAHYIYYIFGLVAAVGYD
jgi:hypothetical protein